MAEQIKISAAFPVPPKKIYDAWLNSKEHSAMTCDKAIMSAKPGRKFTAGGGYITGKNLDLIPNKRILQSWRSTDFKEGQLDSFLLVKFDEAANGTKITLIHSEIPDGQGTSYKKGWKDFYITPMRKYFSKK